LGITFYKAKSVDFSAILARLMGQNHGLMFVFRKNSFASRKRVMIVYTAALLAFRGYSMQNVIDAITGNRIRWTVTIGGGANLSPFR
jgi:hypothetical protein